MIKVQRLSYRHAWHCAAITLLVAAMSSLCVAASGAPTTSPQNNLAIPDDVRSICAQARQTYDEIKNVTYHYHCTYTLLDRPKQNTFDGTVVQASEDGYETVHEVTHFDTNTPSPTSSESSAFIGPTSCGNWNRESVAMEYQYSAPANMSDKAKNSLYPTHAPHPEKCAFGNTRTLLWDMLDEATKDPNTYRWKSVETKDAAGHRILQLQMSETWNSAWPALPSTVFNIDPAKGFTVSHIEERMPYAPYPLIRETDIDVIDVDGLDHWYPRHFCGLTTGYQRMLHEATETIYDNNVVFPPQIQNSDFSIKSLNLPEGQLLDLIAADGSEKMLRVTKAGYTEIKLGN